MPQTFEVVQTQKSSRLFNLYWNCAFQELKEWQYHRTRSQDDEHLTLTILITYLLSLNHDYHIFPNSCKSMASFLFTFNFITETGFIATVFHILELHSQLLLEKFTNDSPFFSLSEMFNSTGQHFNIRLLKNLEKAYYSPSTNLEKEIK